SSGFLFCEREISQFDEEEAFAPLQIIFIGIKSRVVTLVGQVIEKSGAMSGGDHKV
ncbi:11449_t:CDS:1, partial [Funneliformis mosseae]